MTRTFPLGDEIQATATFTSRTTGVASNPTTVVFRLRDPNGVESVVPTVTNPRVGYYMATFTPNWPGIWHSRWEGTGLVQAAIESQFEVRPSVFSNAQ